MSNRSLAREMLAERARKQKLNASDKAVINMNRYYNSALNNTIQDMVRTTRHKIYTVEFNRKNFLEERRKSLANMVVLETPQSLKRYRYYKRRKKSDAELMRILERQEERKDKMDLLKPDPLDLGLRTQLKYSFPPISLTEKELKKFNALQVDTTEDKTKHQVTLNDKTVIPQISDNNKPESDLKDNTINTQPTDHSENKDSEDVLNVKENVDKLNDNKEQTPGDHINENIKHEEQNNDPIIVIDNINDDTVPANPDEALKEQALSALSQYRSPSSIRTNRSDPYENLFSSYLHPLDYNDPGHANLLYMLALNKEEIERYELKKKTEKLQRRLKNQSKSNGKIVNNAKEWMKHWDEERRNEMVEEALRKAAEEEAKKKRRKEREAQKKRNKFETYVYSSDEET